MSKTLTASGQCLCKAVTLKTSSLSANMGTCHCGMCHKWTGGPWFVSNCAQDLTIEGQENVAVFRSSDWAERTFCKKCGTHLFYKLLPNSTYYVSTGVLNSAEFVFDHQIFIDKKQKYFSFSEKTNDMTEAEFLKMFGGQ